MKSISKSLFVIAVLLAVTFSVTAPGLAQEPQPPAAPPAFAPGEVLVKFEPGVSAQGAQSSLQVEGLQPLELLPHGGFVRVKVEPGQELETIARLRARGDVEVAEPNYVAYALDTFPDDYGSQWAISKIGAPAAWDITTGGSNVIIAVVDTGIDMEHPDFSCSGKLLRGWDFAYDDGDPDDDQGHGSHVAGIAAACTNNGFGISGVAWGARLLPVKVLDASGNGYYSDVADGIMYAADAGAQIINLSLGGTGDSSLMKYAVQYAYDRGALVVTAAGNYAHTGNPIFYPAAYTTTLAVAATDSGDNWPYFSEHHPYVDVAAPGVSIYSTWKNGSYTTISGTSMATPHVSGLAALIWSFAQDLPRNEVVDLIQSQADDLGEPGKDDYFGYGRINAGRTLAALPIIGLQTASGQTLSPDSLFFMADPDDGPLPAAIPLLVSANTTTPITWTAVISPEVSWLALNPLPSGLTSASTPGEFTLTATRPAAIGVYTTSLLITGALPSGAVIGPLDNTVRFNYVPELKKYHFPIIVK